MQKKIRFQVECSATEGWCGCCERPKAKFVVEVVVGVHGREISIEIQSEDRDVYVWELSGG